MISTLFIFIVVLAKIHDNEAISTNPYRFRVDNAKNRKNREELAQIIKYINDNADSGIEQNEEPEIGVDNGNYNLVDLMKLAQNNYDTKVEFDLKKPGSSVRLHVINNPEILQDYVKNLRRRHHSTSSESSDSDSDYRMQRRNADYDDIKDEPNESLENTKKKKTFVKGNIDFKIKDGQLKHGNSIKSSEKYDDEPIKVETPTTKKKKKPDTIDDTWAAIKKSNDDVKDDIDKFKTTRRDFKMKKRTYKDYDSPSQKERKKQTVMSKVRKNSWENEDNSWKKTTKRTEKWEVGNKKKEYDSFESKTKKKKITHDYAPPKNNKKYDDDDNWTKNKRSKKTTSSWDKLTTLWERNTIRKKQRDSYVKPSYNSRNSDYHKIGRYGGGSSFLGRTPIPFVGKKGIYED